MRHRIQSWRGRVKSRYARLYLVVILMFGLFGSSLGAPLPVLAATITVSTTEDINDAGYCGFLTRSSLPGPDAVVSLREAICAANNSDGADTITFAQGLGRTIFIGGEPFSISSDLTIIGPDENRLLLRAPNYREGYIFHITNGTVNLSNIAMLQPGDETKVNGGGMYIQQGTVTLDNMIVSGGNARSGGGGITVAGTGDVTIRDSVISNNRAGIQGGGILVSSYYTGNLTIDRSTISNNTVIEGGGAGILLWGGHLLLTNSTISGNRTGVYAGGGGIAIDEPIWKTSAVLINDTISGNTTGVAGGGIEVTGGSIAISFTTITGNVADADNNGSGDGGGIVHYQIAAPTIRNSIVAGNFDRGGQHPDCYGSMQSGDYNLVGSTADCLKNTSNDAQLAGSVDTVLNPQRANNGGPTETHALRVPGPAIDAIPGTVSDCAGKDQRGYSRPNNIRCDIGAFESQAEATTITVDSASSPYNGTVNLRATLAEAGGGTTLSNRSIAFSINGTGVGTATTNSSGVAALTGVSLGGQDAGDYVTGLRATFTGEAGHLTSSATAKLTITPLNQTIAFDPPPNRTTDEQTFTVSAVATSGLQVKFSVYPDNVCYGTNDDRGTIVIVDVGTCTINAYQFGNVNYVAAPNVIHSVRITKAAQKQTIAFDPIADKALNAQPFTVDATASSGLPVNFAATPGSVCTVAGNTLSLIGAGACTITATQAGDATYAAAAPVSHTFTVALASVNLSVTAQGPGVVNPGDGSYPLDSTVALTPQPDAGAIFAGWIVDGESRGWAAPLTLTMNEPHTVQGTFLPRPQFGDVTAETPYAEAIGQLAARGIIKGCDQESSPKQFCPTAPILRAQMAALIARTMGWAGAANTNPFKDQCDPTNQQNCVDGELWAAVGQLATRQIASGYSDAPTCGGAENAPCFAPRDNVTYAQAISFITRTMVQAGYWQQATTDDPTLYPDVPASSGHRLDIVIYVANAGALPGTATATAALPQWAQPATRAWFAEALWRALNGYFGSDQPGHGGYLP